MTETTKTETEWVYRNITCRVYHLGHIKTLGYVQVGDKWVQVVEKDGRADDIQGVVESMVDTIINAGIESVEETDAHDTFDPLPDIDINPPPEPSPRPTPWPNPTPDSDPPDPHYPNGPIWNGRNVWDGLDIDRPFYIEAFK